MNKHYLASDSALGIIDVVVNYGIKPTNSDVDNTNLINKLKTNIGTADAIIYFRAGAYPVLAGTTFPANIHLIGFKASFVGIATTIPDIDGGGNITPASIGAATQTDMTTAQSDIQKALKISLLGGI